MSLVARKAGCYRPVMLTFYLIAGIVGGSLIVLSALGGIGDHDADLELDHDVDLEVDGDVDLEVDVDHDVDLDLDHDVDHDVDVANALDGIDPEGIWLPFLSLRFWTYFAAGFGITGGLLTWLGTLIEPVIAASAGGTGLVAGLAMSYAMRALKRGEAHGHIGLRDYQGSEGSVLVAIQPGGTGKIRTRVRGEELDLLATSESTEPLVAGTPIIIIDMVDAQARVVRRSAITGD